MSTKTFLQQEAAAQEAQWNFYKELSERLAEISTKYDVHIQVDAGGSIAIHGDRAAEASDEIAKFQKEAYERTVRRSAEVPKKQRIFVFGSNLAGIHGAGSAKAAHEKYGAIWGQGVGHYGNSYAIPTKDQRLNVLPLDVIRYYVDMFVEYARQHPELEFEVVKIGCGLAGFREDQIAPLFVNAGPNCILPEGWR